jgi:hypothetical protein
MKKQLILAAFFMGILFCAFYNNKKFVEGFNTRADCPNLLVKRGNKIMLLNNRKARIPGVNPIYFDNLEEYIEFTNWQRSQNIKCPVLYFNEVQDAQGNTNYRMLNSISNPQAGLPSYISPAQESNDDISSSNEDYQGINDNSHEASSYTPLDKAYNTNKPSADAMDVNWAGKEYSRRMVQLGRYKSDEVLNEFNGN